MAKLRPGTTEVINRCSKMKDVETLHREAMELVARAVVARQRGDVSDFDFQPPQIGNLKASCDFDGAEP
jgi:hypothetical protein